MTSETIKRIFVRRYRDNGQMIAYCEYEDGSRTGGTCRRIHFSRGDVIELHFSFGVHMHQLFRRAKCEGLRMEREMW